MATKVSFVSMIFGLKSSLTMVHNAPIVYGRSASASICSSTTIAANVRDELVAASSLRARKSPRIQQRPAPDRRLEFRSQHPTTMAKHDNSALPSMPNGNTPRLLARLPVVLKVTGLGRSTIYRWIADGSFPAPVRLGPRAVAWRWADLDRWTQSRTATHH
jgi:prophage regulatory protein